MKNRWLPPIALLALGAFAGIADASSPPPASVFPPVDQAARDPAFLAFLDNLRVLVRARRSRHQTQLRRRLRPRVLPSIAPRKPYLRRRQLLAGTATSPRPRRRFRGTGRVLYAVYFLPTDSGLRDLRPVRNAGRGRSERADPRRAGRRLEDNRQRFLRRRHRDRQQGLSMEPRPRARRKHAGDRGLRLAARVPLPHRLSRVFPKAARRQLANDPFHRRRLTGAIGNGAIPADPTLRCHKPTSSQVPAL